MGLFNNLSKLFKPTNATGMKKCIKCSQDIDSTSVFCKYCGWNQSTPAPISVPHALNTSATVVSGSTGTARRLRHTNIPTTPTAVEVREVRKPPAIVNMRYLRYYYHSVKICKEKNLNLNSVKVNEWVDLTPEPTNPYDSNAVMITAKDGTKLGYIYRGNHQDMCNKWLTSNDGSRDLISKITNTDADGDVYIYLAFYQNLTDDMFKKRFTTTVSEKNYEENLLDVGDCVHVGYDVLKDKYRVEDWGNVPKASNSFYESISGDSHYTSFIENLEETDSGSYRVSVATVYIP